MPARAPPESVRFQCMAPVPAAPDALRRGKLQAIAPRPCKLVELRIAMEKPNFFNDLQAKINQAIENSPAKDLEKNVKAMLNQGFSKLDLVTREEFEIQAQVLAKTRANLELLEARVAELEAQRLEAQRDR